MRRLLIIFACVIPTAGFAFQWDIAKEPVPHSSEVPVAVVTNDLGHSLKVYLDDAGVVRGMFTINGGFDALATTICPTYRVDERRPRVVGIGETSCQIEPKRAHFTFGQQQGSEVRSTELHRLMNGTAIVFSYQLETVGYRQSLVFASPVEIRRAGSDWETGEDRQGVRTLA